MSIAQKLFTSACWRILLAVSIITPLAGCEDKTLTPAEIRDRIKYVIPSSVKDREAWAADIQYAMASLEIEPSAQNYCAVLAVTEQESSFVTDPVVPGLGEISLKEIEARAARMHVPVFAVRAALQLKSPNGDPWQERIAASRTEKQLSDIFEEMISTVPMGTRLLASANPVHTGGPMQVSIAYAQAHAKQRKYPYTTDASIRHEVFSRRGGMYFGIAHLLDYEASYDKPLFRFADFNAGHYASRNAAFQNAIAVATGIALDLDGDLIRYGKQEISSTEAAVRSMAAELGMTPDKIHAQLLASNGQSFEQSELYLRVFEIADKRNGKPLPHATLPRIRLQSPKITRKLTTEWFANRVNQRYKKCLARAEKQP